MPKTPDILKEKFEKLLDQAKESVKVLETLQKEGISKVISILPSPDDTKKMTNEKIVSSLRKLGLATRSEVEELEKKVENLASELRSQIVKLNRKSSGKQKSEHNSETR
ncbi:MAG: hypothetical protein AB7F43_02740 [Bacteriovoracia bacterium]